MEPITTLLLYLLGCALCGATPFTLAVVAVVLWGNAARAAGGRRIRR